MGIAITTFNEFMINLLKNLGWWEPVYIEMKDNYLKDLETVNLKSI